MISFFCRSMLEEVVLRPNAKHGPSSDPSDGAAKAESGLAFAFAWRRCACLFVVFLTSVIELRAAPPDKQAPTTPTNLVASAVMMTGFTVTWTASADNVAVTGYEVLLGGVSQGTVTTTSKVFTGLQPGTAYSVTVRARDAAANWSVQTSALAVTTTADSSPPSIPIGLAASGVTSSSFTLSWSASTDNVAVTSYEVFLGGVSQGTVTTISKNITGLLSSALYSVTVRAKDGAGNWSAQSSALSVTTTSDTTPPSVPAGLVASNVTSTSFSVSWSPSTDNGTVAGYEVFLGGASQGTVAATSKSLIGLQPSTAYSVTVRAQDNAGNWSAQSGPLAVTTSVNLQIAPTIAASGGHTIFLSAEGKVWMWGLNDAGQFGNGTLVSSSAPILVNGWGTVKQVGVGNSCTVALRTDGTVWSSGSGGLGQLGNGGTVNKSTPVQVTGLTNVIAIAVGSVSGYALKADGTVWAWGYNYDGEMGDGTITSRSSPVRVQGLSGISAISAGWAFGLALGADGKVWGWGSNIGNTGNNLVPVQITGLPTIQKITALTSDALVLDGAGQVWAWGFNSYGESGNGTTTSHGTPATISGLPAVVKLFGGFGCQSPAVLTASNQLYGWGRNDYGQAKPPAQPSPNLFVLTPQLFTELGSITAKTSAGGTSYYIQSNGIIRSWGGTSASDVRFGYANVVIGSVPIPLNAQAGFAQIAFGSDHGLLIDKTNNLWSIGENASGQLGDGTTVARVALRKIVSPSNVVQVAANDQTSGGLTTDGKLWLWGNNSSGRLGDGTLADRLTPYLVPGLSAVRGFDVGTAHTLAVLTNGEVWAWGYNFWSQLGFTPSSGIYNYPTPRKVAGISTAVGVAAGPSHSLALLADGTVLQWGVTSTTTETRTPTLVSRLSGVKKVAAGESFSIALLQNGTVSAWGRNDVGQLGNGSTTNSTRPVQVSGLTNIVDISVYSGAGAIALRNDGTVWVWGGGNNLSPVRVGTISDVRAFGGRSGANIGLIRGDETPWVSGSFVYAEAQLTDLFYQVVDVRAFAASNDADNDGLPDQWEMTYFGNLNQKAGDDFDADGVSNAQEYVLGTNPALIDSDGDLIPDWLDEFPLDFFNGVAPSLTILGGNNQGSPPGVFNAAPLEVAVWDAVRFVPIVSAPVNWSITQGGGALSLTPNGSALVSSLSVNTDVDGTARVYFKQPSGAAVVSKISATTGLAQVVFTTSNSVDSDGDGLTDAQEAALGTNPNNPDTDGDGSSDFAEYRVGRNPLAGVLPGGGAALNLVVLQPSN